MQAIGFGYKTSWIAVRDTPPRALAAALRLADVVETGWDEGLDAADELGNGAAAPLFVMGPVDGWTLAASFRLSEAIEGSGPPLRGFLATLSAALDGAEVQYFATHRIVEQHAWGCAKNGKTLRAYGFVGESGRTLENYGEPTTAERELGFDFYDERVSGDPSWEDDVPVPNEDDVMRLAERWSVDPTALGERGLDVAPGLLGTFVFHDFVEQR